MVRIQHARALALRAPRTSPTTCFARILENAHFLAERFFDQLPPTAAGIECYHEWETLYFHASGDLMDILGVDCDVDELARRWPGELRAVFHQRVWRSELELRAIDLGVTRPGINRTQLYDELVALGYPIQAVHDKVQAVSGRQRGWLLWNERSLR